MSRPGDVCQAFLKPTPEKRRCKCCGDLEVFFGHGVLRIGFPANALGVGYGMDEVETVATQALAEQLGVSGKDGDLRAQVARVIARMLDRDMQGLFTMFYRLDIAEAKVRQVFNDTQPPDVPDALTTLIIDREVARRRSWLQHVRTQKDLCP